MHISDRRLLFAIGAAALFVLLAGDMATAQIAAPQPQGVLGGGASQSQAARSKLDLAASVVQGYDSDVPEFLLSTIDPTGLQAGGYSTIFNANAFYEWGTSRTQFGANATSALRHYAELGETLSVGHSAGIGLSTQLPGRTRLLANQSAAYSPMFLSGIFPSALALEPGNSGSTGTDFSIGSMESVAYSTTLGVTHDFSRRSALSFGADYVFTDRLRETEMYQDIQSIIARSQFSRSVTRNASLSTQVRYRSGGFGYGTEGNSTEFGVDVGVTLNRTLSASRQATFRFNVGVSGADVPQLVPETNERFIQRQYLGVGRVDLDYQFSRLWRAGVTYRRGLEYIPDVPQPVFADGLSGVVSGLLTRRLDVSMSGGLSSGDSLINRNGLQLDTYVANARGRYALNRTVATYLEYLYYYYQFRGSTELLTGVPSGLQRNGIRAGVMLWVPALRR